MTVATTVPSAPRVGSEHLLAGDAITVVGAGGYVGRRLVERAHSLGADVLATVRDPDGGAIAGATNTAATPDASAFDRLRVDERDGPVVLLPQLQLAAADWLLDRIDGPRWVVMSSAQLSAATPPPGLEIAAARERLAVERGATVLRPTMVFGGGADQNITRLARGLVRTRVPVQLGNGAQLLQPIHVDDLCDAAVIAGYRRPGGVLELGGRDRLTSRELLTNLVELLGLRIPIVSCPDGALSVAARLAPLAGLRPDQIARLHDDKVVDAAATFEALAWRPAPTAHRLEQAIAEAGLGRGQGA